MDRSDTYAGFSVKPEDCIKHEFSGSTAPICRYCGKPETIEDLQKKVDSSDPKDPNDYIWHIKTERKAEGHLDGNQPEIVHAEQAGKYHGFKQGAEWAISTLKELK